MFTASPAAILEEVGEQGRNGRNDVIKCLWPRYLVVNGKGGGGSRPQSNRAEPSRRGIREIDMYI